MDRAFTGNPLNPNSNQTIISDLICPSIKLFGNQLQICNIDYKDYKAGYCFWGYDLTPDQGADQGHLHPIKTGNLRLELQFARALDSTINVIVYAEFDNRIDINGIREVITDY